MAITSVGISQRGGSLDGSGSDPGTVQRNYSIPFIVKTDDATTGDRTSPLAVEQHFRITPTLPFYGRAWKWTFGSGATAVDVQSRCSGLHVEYREKSEGVFDVTADFKPDDGQSKQVEFDPEDPSTWPESVESTSTQISVPAEFGLFRGFDPPGIQNPFLKPNNVYPIVNSAFKPMDPLPERLIEIEIIRLQRYVLFLDEPTKSFRGFINNDVLNIDKRFYGFHWTIPPFCGWIKHIGGVSEEIKGVQFVRREVEVWVNPERWWEKFLDRGLERRCVPGVDKTRAGELISSSNTTINPTRPIHEPIKDGEGIPITEPDLLNGNGQPLRDLAKPVWLYWQLKGDRACAGFPW